MRDPESGPSTGQWLGDGEEGWKAAGMVPACAFFSDWSPLLALDTHFVDEEGQKADGRRGWASRAKG